METVPSNAEMRQSFMATEEYIRGSDTQRQQWFEKFESLPQAEQRAFVNSLTPARDPSAAFRPRGVPSIQEETLEEGITAPSTLVPLAAGAVSIPAGAALPMAYRAVTRPLVEGGIQTLGEMGGQVMETGKAPTLGDVGTSFLLNTLPSGAEEWLRAGSRQVARSGRGGQTILSDEAAQRSKGLGARVFASEEEPVLQAMFNRVRASNVKLDIGNVHTYMSTLTPEEQRLLLREVGKINVPFTQALGASGTPGAPTVRGWDIGELQDLRSELIKASERTRTPQVQDMLTTLREEVDDAIGNATAVGSVPASGMPELLKEAQAGWRRLRAGDELQAIVTKHTGFSPNRAYQDLNLASLSKELEGTTRAGRFLDRQLGSAERDRLKAELDDLSQLYPSVRISGQVGGSVTAGSLLAAGGLAASGQPIAAATMLIPGTLSAVLSSPKAMGIFRQAIINGRGEISPNTVALIASVARQEVAPIRPETPRAPTVPGGVSGQ